MNLLRRYQHEARVDERRALQLVAELVLLVLLLALWTCHA